MRIALPVSDGRLCMHFGHCEQFVIFDVDNKTILSSEAHTPPPHEPGLLPRWLSDRNVQLVIAGGMGARAVSLFREKGVNVITGAPSAEPYKVVDTYLKGELITGINACDH